MARYSYSKLNTYRTCPLQYRFRYIDKIRIEVAPGVEAFMGSRAHDALEWLYKQVGHGRVPTQDDVVAVYNERWDAERPGDLRIVNEDLDEAAYRDAGRRCLELYYRRHTPFDEGIVLGLEEGFQIPLENGIVLNGFIDRLMKTEDGVYEVHDYKTSQRLPTPAKARADEQGGWYALAVRKRFPHAREVRLVWHYLRHDEEIESERTPEEAEALEQDIVCRVRTIEAAAEFPAHESALCDWCDYFGICPAKGHRLAVDTLPPNEYLNEPGVVLVNRLVELRATLKMTGEAMTEEIERVEDALLRYAREHRYTVVVGDDHEATVSESEVVSLPRKDDPAREPLEAAVRRLGLWDDVSDLSLSKLGKALAEGQPPPAARAELAPFAARETRVTIGLRKKRDAEDR